MAIMIGKKAPAFTLLDQNGEKHSLADYSGKKVLLYFYPKDDTPGCTTEACSFRDNLSRLKKYGVQVLGVSCDDTKKHKKFVEKYDLNFPLLADTEKKVVEKYGVWKEKSMYGKKYMGTLRSTFLLDHNGAILAERRNISASEHAKKVLEKAQEVVMHKQ